MAGPLLLNSSKAVYEDQEETSGHMCCWYHPAALQWLSCCGLQSTGSAECHAMGGALCILHTA